MNTITADALLNKRDEIFKNKQNNSNRITPRNENIIDDPLRPVSDMNTFKRKLDNSLRQSIFPPITSPSPPHVRRDTLFERPSYDESQSEDLFSRPTQSKIRKRSQSHQVHTDVQTEAISLNIEDMLVKQQKKQTRKHKGCVQPLHKVKSKGVVNIVPVNTKCDSISVDTKCFDVNL